MINNACATQAILSIILNTKHEDVELGPILTEFKEFSASFNANVSINLMLFQVTETKWHNWQIFASFLAKRFDFNKQQPHKTSAQQFCKVIAKGKP